MIPRIFVVIRTFNDDPAHLHQAIVSAAARSVLPEETIVVDDESTRADLLEFPGMTEKAIQVIRQPNGWIVLGLERGDHPRRIRLRLHFGRDDWMAPQSVVEDVVFSLEAAFLRLKGMHALHPEYRFSAHKWRGRFRPSSVGGTWRKGPYSGRARHIGGELMPPRDPRHAPGHPG